MPKVFMCVCVFITAVPSTLKAVREGVCVPITKLFARGGRGGGGGEWSTCATRDYEPRSV